VTFFPETMSPAMFAKRFEPQDVVLVIKGKANKFG